MTDSHFPDAATGGKVALLAMALVSAALFGNFYVYDSVGPVADLLQRQLGFTDTQIGTLNAIYSLPNIVLVLVGGILVDRLGAGKTLFWTAGICFLGAGLTAASPGFVAMATGRLLFGIGAETFNIATLSAVTLFYPRRHTALMMGITLGMGRAGSWVADLSPSIWSKVYAAGWQPPLVLAAGIAATSFVASGAYWMIEHRAARRVGGAAQAAPFAWRDVYRFGPSYWYLVLLCVLWYGVILAFRSTFAIKYFQHVHGLSLEEAGQINAHVFLAALFATPAFGWLCDRLGRYAGLLAFGALLLPVSLSIMAVGNGGLGLATVLIGVSYSLVPAAMWPLVSRIVEAKKFGTAIGLMWVIQNAGIAGANLVAGWLNDQGLASARHPAGYGGMMAFFIASSALGFVFAVLLWLRTRERVRAVPAPAGVVDAGERDR
ncbi:MAG TPA: MFS transporter [Anaeromyxobacteraceae bacterium]|nr:MFS transporter [Anaeromyxobacteraceae bacterium]